MDPFYHYDYPLNYDDDEEKIMATLRAKLIAGTDKRMMSDRPIGCLVSGGVDSSLVAALVARHYSPGNLHTFTVGLDTGASDRAAIAEALRGVSFESPRGPAEIDAATNNIVQDVYIYETVKEGEGLTQKVLGKVESVRDEPNGCALN